MSQLDDDITQAQQYLNTGQYYLAYSNVIAYYEAQPGRGYSAVALAVLNDTGWVGAAANDAVINAVGASNYYAGEFRVGLAVALASADNKVRNDDIKNGYNGGVVNAMQITDYHYTVYQQAGLDPSVWGGACLASMGADPFLGQLHADEMGGGFGSNLYSQNLTTQLRSITSVS